MWIPNASATPVAEAPPPTQVAGGPVNTALPTISGVAKVGHFLNINYGTWTYRPYVLIPRIIFDYQWKRGGIPITGATDPIYQITADDIGSVITVDEIATDFYGTTTATTPGTAVVTADDRTVITAESLGLKAIETRGAIEVGTNELTVVSAAGFAVNDAILVEPGDGTGVGLRGTVGVGGTWPALSYANAAAMNADTTKPQNTFAYLEDTKKVYRYTAGWIEWSATIYYWNLVLPLAIRTTITAIDGNVLTLAQTASATVTNARVFFDNAPRANVVGNGFVSNAIGNDKVITFGAGTYAFGDRWIFTKHNNIWFKGNGPDGDNKTVWLAPHGVPSISLQISGDCLAPTVTGIRLIGNNTHTGSMPPTPVSGTSSGTYWTDALDIAGSTVRGFFQDCAAENCSRVLDVVGQSFWARRVHTFHVGQLSYFQWAFNWADSYRGGAIDCSATNEILMASCETFRGRETRFYRFVGHNALVSNNTAGDFLWRDCELTFDPQGAEPPYQLLQGTPMMSINANVGTSSGSGLTLQDLGGEVRNLKMNQLSYFTYAGQQFNMIGIIVALGYKNVHVTGTSSYDAPGFQSGITNSPRAFGCDVTHQLNSVTGMTVKCALNPSGFAIQAGITFTQSTGGIIVNCVADAVNAEVKSGNRTRAQFIADGGNLNRTSPPA